jgi:hypothetical protein
MHFKTFALSASLVSLVFSGCTPLLNKRIQHQIRHIRIGRIDDRIGQKLRQKLEQRMQSSDQMPLYALDVNLSETNHALVLNRQGQNAVGHYILKAQYTFSRLHDHCVLSKGTTRFYGVKPLSISYYSQTVMDQATQDRAIDATVEKLMYAVITALDQEPPCPCLIQKIQRPLPAR